MYVLVRHSRKEEIGSALLAVSDHIDPLIEHSISDAHHYLHAKVKKDDWDFGMTWYCMVPKAKSYYYIQEIRKV